MVLMLAANRGMADPPLTRDLYMRMAGTSIMRYRLGRAQRSTGYERKPAFASPAAT
jgi:hypothetical protein